jgi:pimeloyl-ACP methyl ester carboxylesterase
MERLGFARFSVAGHDRGGRVAYRMAIDHPDRVDRLAVLDVLPTETVWERAAARFALGFWPWSLLALWRAWGDDVRGRTVRAGHFFLEEAPEQTAEALSSFFGGA